MQNQRDATITNNMGDSNWNGGNGNDNNSTGETLGAAALGTVGGMAIGSMVAQSRAQNPYPPPPPAYGYYPPPPPPPGYSPYYYGGQVQYAPQSPYGTHNPPGE
jgi:hypothetical protein